ncbi:hypothetical protein ACK8HH_17075 [Gordonia sp. LUNF6]|uniref:hypothetical protein n=1 Tax=unclassified Gordonia (in: high G+C Gram-positive bacteria) TaxID=2657482 RepID=UPI000785B685|nr:hypothetical protein [Gordonia sp. QH-12]
MSRRKKSPLQRGILRDDQGVVVGRRTQHPHSHLLTAIPTANPDYPGMPPFNMPAEMKQLIAIHVFDNLYPGLPEPPAEGESWTITDADGNHVADVGSSRYRLVNPTGDSKPMGGNGETWLAHAVPAEAAVPAEMDEDELAAVPDVDDLTEAQFAALQAKVDQRLEDDARLAAMDAQAQPTETEWQKWRREKFGLDGGDES